MGLFTESVMLTLLRFGVYTLLVFGFTVSLSLFVQPGDLMVFKEGGPVETLQLLMLLGASAVFMAGTLFVPAFRYLWLVLAAISMFAVSRELDLWLDRLLPWVGWQIGFALLLFAGVVTYVYRRELVLQIARFIESRAFSILWAGFIVAVPFAQLIGHGAFLKLVLGEAYVSGYKRVVEESGEIIGYFLILIGSIEALIQMGHMVLATANKPACSSDPKESGQAP